MLYSSNCECPRCKNIYNESEILEYKSEKDRYYCKGCRYWFSPVDIKNYNENIKAAKTPDTIQCDNDTEDFDIEHGEKYIVQFCIDEQKAKEKFIEYAQIGYISKINTENIKKEYVPFIIVNGKIKGVWRADGIYTNEQSDNVICYDAYMEGHASLNNFPVLLTEKYPWKQLNDVFRKIDLNSAIELSSCKVQNVNDEETLILRDTNEIRSRILLATKNYLKNEMLKTIDEDILLKNQVMHGDLKYNTSGVVVYLPMWAYSVKIKGKRRHLLLNGQTGLIVNDIPESAKKLFCYYLAFSIVVSGIAMLIACMVNKQGIENIKIALGVFTAVFLVLLFYVWLFSNKTSNYDDKTEGEYYADGKASDSNAVISKTYINKLSNKKVKQRIK